ncbi:ATP-dependent RNA helicase abstrakt [Hydra vulgaris]|uniref:ATP-dependent RNA helicase abstrakt n=1 Tax=Hydra vulgaris TaxID=6087 RepID=UPI0002B419B6|nr:ATP-dependent RNA helicase abstrakt [Hydra vulgaris]
MKAYKPLRWQPDVSLVGSKEQLPYNNDTEKLRNKYGIEVDGENVPAPMLSFEEMELPYWCMNYLSEKLKIYKPTPIQMQAISCILNNRDVIGLSATGSGKTYAYLLPICGFLNKQKYNIQSEISPLCLIVVPTRELMNQVRNIFIEVLSNMPIDRDNLYFKGPNQIALETGYQYPQTNIYISNMYQLPLHDVQHQTLKNSIDSLQMLNSNIKTNNNFKTDWVSNRCVAGFCGGTSVSHDVSQLGPYTKVVVSTPGRLIDLCERNLLSLAGIKYLVIDECDRMLDEFGMEEQLRKIIALVTINKNDIHTSLWSATLPASLERIARSATINPVYICTGVEMSVPQNITQNVIFMHTYMKHKHLLETLRRTPYPPVIIFTNSKAKADSLTEFLLAEQFHVAAIHSDKTQLERNQVLSDFRENLFDVLVATDLMSRGLDIVTVTHVINFDTPDTIEDYIHRCGRTGRFGRPGLATTFLTLDCKISKELKDLLEASKSDIPIELNDLKNFGKKILVTDMGDKVCE